VSYHGLEVVDVEQQHAQAVTRSLSAGDFFPEPVEPEAAVVQPGQRVEGRQLLLAFVQHRVVQGDAEGLPEHLDHPLGLGQELIGPGEDDDPKRPDLEQDGDRSTHAERTARSVPADPGSAGASIRTARPDSIAR
jgi:hypothetical protein